MCFGVKATDRRGVGCRLGQHSLQVERECAIGIPGAGIVKGDAPDVALRDGRRGQPRGVAEFSRGDFVVAILKTKEV